MPRPRQLDMNTLTAAPKHAELVAVLRGLHMATRDILRVVGLGAAAGQAPHRHQPRTAAGASQGVIITGTDLTLVTLHSFTWI